MENTTRVPDWAKQVGFGIIVCDTEGTIIYMNDTAIAAKKGDLTGTNIFGCHNPRSIEIIRSLLKNGGCHAYTVEKEGKKKIIYQCPWKEDGEIRGLCEIMAEFTGDLPHVVRS